MHGIIFFEIFLGFTFFLDFQVLEYFSHNNNQILLLVKNKNPSKTIKNSTKMSLSYQMKIFFLICFLDYKIAYI